MIFVSREAKMQRRVKRVGLLLTPEEKMALARLAETEGLSEAATLRRLLHRAMKELYADAEPLVARAEGPQHGDARHTSAP